MVPLDEQKGALAAAQAAAAPLPCLRSNNSIEGAAHQGPDESRNGRALQVSKGAYKTEHCLKENIRIAAEEYGLEMLAFVTITFAKAIFSAKCAQQRMNSLLTNVIRPRYGKRYIGVLERHESGAIHFHFIIYVGTDKDHRFGRAVTKQGGSFPALIHTVRTHGFFPSGVFSSHSTVYFFPNFVFSSSTTGRVTPCSRSASASTFHLPILKPRKRKNFSFDAPSLCFGFRR